MTDEPRKPVVRRCAVTSAVSGSEMQRQIDAIMRRLRAKRDADEKAAES